MNGIRLNYLDWGGVGPTLVLIHGLTDSPHIFDDFAPLLRDRVHVIAYARRGHAGSDAPPNGSYDLATLVDDLRQLLDHLGIDRTSMLGWSMGGNEITEFAAKYPDRVDKLVYLEAGYDWSYPKYQEFPAPEPATADLRSLDAYRTWYRKAWFGKTPWTPGLEAYLRDITHIAADGSVHPTPSGTVLDALVASNFHSSRRYRDVRAPALALYASSFLPMDASDPKVMQASHDWETRVMAEFRRASLERVRQELPNVQIREFPNTAHVSILVLEQEAIATAVREFMGQPGKR